MKRFAGHGGWNTNRFHGNSAGRGRSMTNPAWVSQNGGGFGSFGDGNNGPSSAVPPFERNIRNLQPGSRQ